jgi:hypothetical protein
MALRILNVAFKVVLAGHRNDRAAGNLGKAAQGIVYRYLAIHSGLSGIVEGRRAPSANSSLRSS